MPGYMDGYLYVRSDGTCRVTFAGVERADGLTEAAAREFILGITDGRDLWRVPEDGAYEAL